MFMLDPMAALKALVSLLSSLPTMLAMLFSNSTAMIGKVAHWRFVKTASLALVVDLVLVVVSADAEALAVVQALFLQFQTPSQTMLCLVQREARRSMSVM